MNEFCQLSLKLATIQPFFMSTFHFCDDYHNCLHFNIFWRKWACAIAKHITFFRNIFSLNTETKKINKNSGFPQRQYHLLLLSYLSASACNMIGHLCHLHFTMLFAKFISLYGLPKHLQRRTLKQNMFNRSVQKLGKSRKHGMRYPRLSS